MNEKELLIITLIKIYNFTIDDVKILYNYEDRYINNVINKYKNYKIVKDNYKKQFIIY